MRQAQFAQARHPVTIDNLRAVPTLVSRLDLLPRGKIEREMAYLANAVGETAGPSEQQAWAWPVERVRARYPGHEDG